MSSPAHIRAPPAGAPPGGASACVRCLRRSWLLGLLGGVLEYASRGEGRLLELLALGDGQLVAAVGGSRRSELRARYARFDPDELRPASAVQAVCRHDRRYPPALSGSSAPWMLHVAGDIETLFELMRGPTVAIVGASRASDYGLQIASSLARGLSASGVTVIATLSEGIACAAHTGALQGATGSVAVLGGGVDVAYPARRLSLYERVRSAGCVVAELPCGLASRRWALRAGERIVAALAELTVVVEADDSARDLSGAHMAQALGRPLAAIPGRVTSPLSRGTHALLMHGASLVRGARDVLDLLGASDARRSPPVAAGAGLCARLRRTLEQVGAGLDTPDRLLAAGADPETTMLALAELELMGLLYRGDGARYVLREALDA